jgi:hypothetical protein
MTGDRKSPAWEAADALFVCHVAPETKSAAVQEYKARQAGELEKMKRLREARLARDSALGRPGPLPSA